MERLYAPNEGYVLLEHSHTHKYLGTWSIVSTCVYARAIASARVLLAIHCQPDDIVGDYSSASEYHLLTCLESIHPVSIEHLQPSLTATSLPYTLPTSLFRDFLANVKIRVHRMSRLY